MTYDSNKICWHENGKDRCCLRHDGARGFSYGRCKSGRRWFWTVCDWQKDWARTHGWEDTEQAAIEAARAEVMRLAEGHDAFASMTQNHARWHLKDLNAEKRRAKPPSNAKGSRAIEYLYGTTERYRIIKRTKQRVYYVKNGEDIDDRGEPIDYPHIRHLEADEVGFITLTKLKGGRYRWLYPSLEEMLAERVRYDGLGEKKPDLAALKAAMAAAHPDKGGSSEKFIAARQAYVAARRGGVTP